MGYKVAVAGATGNVGREMLDILAERRFPVSEVVALASSRSIGTEVSFGDKTLKCRHLDTYDFSDTDICLMSAGGDVSREWAPRIGAQGCVVIDNSSAWRMDPDVPLIVPEVNAEAAAGFTKKNIIANPNCSTAQLVVALKPLHDAAKIMRVVVSTYQSVSGAGKEGMDELFAQTRAVFVSDSVEAKKFPKHIAFNSFRRSTSSWKTASPRKSGRWSSRRRRSWIPRSSSSRPACACRCSSAIREAVNIEFERPISADEARDILREAPGVLVIDKHEAGGYITPHEAAGEDATYIRASAMIRPSITASCCGASRTICARARRSTPFRSRKSWSTESC